MSDQRTIAIRVQDALHDVATATVPDSLVPPGLPPAARHRQRRLAAVVSVAAAVVAVALVGVLARPDGGSGGSHPVGGPLTAPVSSGVPARTSPVGAFCDNFSPVGCAHPRYQPLWPYTSYAQASRYRAGAPASQAWRHSPSSVGRRYLRVLGYRGVTITENDPSHHVPGVTGVSFSLVDRAGRVVGNLDLEQYGTTTTAPYEVVGVPTFIHPGRFFGLDLPRRTATVDGSFYIKGRHAAPGAEVRVRTLSVTHVIGTHLVRADSSGHWTAGVVAATRGVTTVTADSQGTRSQPRRLLIEGFAQG